MKPQSDFRVDKAQETPVWRLLSLGVAWGLIVMVTESFSTPIERMALPQIVYFVLDIAPTNMSLSVGTVFLVAWLAPRTTPWGLASAFVAFATVHGLLQIGWDRLAYWTGMAGSMEILFGRPRPVLTVFLYDIWLTLFYGAPFAAALAFNARADRGRALLARLQISLSRSEAAMHTSRASSLSGGVSPTFLLEAITRLQALYESHPDQAELLLNDLVAFLRTANVGHVKRISSLSAEVQLLHTYVRVLGHVSPQLRIAFSVAETPPDLAFPAQTLIPLLNDLIKLDPEARVRVDLQPDDLGWRLTLTSDAVAAGPWLESNIESRLRSAEPPWPGQPP